MNIFTLKQIKKSLLWDRHQSIIFSPVQWKYHFFTQKMEKCPIYVIKSAIDNFFKSKEDFKGTDQRKNEGCCMGKYDVVL